MSRKNLYIFLTSLSVVALFVLNLFVGAADIPLQDVVKILIWQEHDNESWRYILLEIGRAHV